MTLPHTLEASAPSPFQAQCTQCHVFNPPGLRFCEKCGSPLNDDIFDMLHAPALKEGRKWMGWVAILYLASGFLMGGISWSSDPDTGLGIIIINTMLAATQAGLWWWAKRATFPAAVVSLTLYGTIVLMNAIADPMTLVQGWLIKIFFVGALLKAIQAGLAVRRSQNAMRQAV